jgi:sigma54-dependent transcription regulator
VARLIHTDSARRGRAFIAVNCSGIPETLLESELFGHVRGSFTGAFRDKTGLVQQADQGTLFLDEVGEMSLRMQAALLRFTETGEVQRVGGDSGVTRTDVRLIAATNRDLRAQITAGAFREDLFYRLNVIQIQVPPLRDRGEDILRLLEHYVDQAAQVHGFPPPRLTPDAAQLLLACAWPEMCASPQPHGTAGGRSVAPGDARRPPVRDPRRGCGAGDARARRGGGRTATLRNAGRRHGRARATAVGPDAGRRRFLDRRASALQGA